MATFRKLSAEERAALAAAGTEIDEKRGRKRQAPERIGKFINTRYACGHVRRDVFIGTSELEFRQQLRETAHGLCPDCTLRDAAIAAFGYVAPKPRDPRYERAQEVKEEKIGAVKRLVSTAEQKLERMKRALEYLETDGDVDAWMERRHMEAERIVADASYKLEQGTTAKAG